MMFAAVLEKGKSYKQTNELPYHVTMAALEPAEGKKGFVSVFVDTEDHEGTLMCTLKHNENLQVNLDLMFEEDNEVHFYIKGDGRVHLSGYVMAEDPMGAYDGFDEEGDSNDEEVSDVSDADDDLRAALNAKRKIDAEKAVQGAGKKIKLANGDAKVNGAAVKAEKVPKLKAGGDSDDDDDSEEDESMDEEMDEEELQAMLAKIKAAGGEVGDSDESDDDESEGDDKDVKVAQNKLKEQLKKGGDKPGQTPKPKGAPQQQSPQKGQQAQKPKFTPGDKKAFTPGQKGGQGQKGGSPGGQQSGKKPWDNKNKQSGGGGKPWEKNKSPNQGGFNKGGGFQNKGGSGGKPWENKGGKFSGKKAGGRD